MRGATVLLVALLGLAGCGDSERTSPIASTTTTSAPTVAAPATATTGAPPAATPGGRSRFVDVSSLVGKPLAGEPGCRFARSVIPDRPSARQYDGALTLSVRCPRTDDYTPFGQIVNRTGSKPSEITCRAARGKEQYCIYVPSSSVGLYFTGTDRAVVRRRLERLVDVVGSLPNGVTPLPAAPAP